MFRLLVLLFSCVAAFGALPNGWKACSRSDPDYSQCLGKEIENAVKSLADGDKKLGVLPLDPLRISKLEFATGDGPISIQFSLRDADLYGLKSIQVINVKNDWKTMNIKIFIAPELEILLNYELDGEILLLPIKGEGRGNITFEDLSVDAEIQWERIKKENTEYFNMESLTMPVEPKKMTTNLDNLFDGNKALSDQTNIFLNENWKIILDAMKGLISRALSTIFKQIANQVLSQIPANEIDT